MTVEIPRVKNSKPSVHNDSVPSLGEFWRNPCLTRSINVKGGKVMARLDPMPNPSSANFPRCSAQPFFLLVSGTEHACGAGLNKKRKAEGKRNGKVQDAPTSDYANCQAMSHLPNRDYSNL